MPEERRFRPVPMTDPGRSHARNTRRSSGGASRQMKSASREVPHQPREFSENTNFHRRRPGHSLSARGARVPEDRPIPCLFALGATPWAKFHRVHHSEHVINQAGSSNPRGGGGKPRYRSALREAQAAQTRTTVLEAAAELFVREGYLRTTMRQVATAYREPAPPPRG